MEGVIDAVAFQPAARLLDRVAIGDAVNGDGQCRTPWIINKQPLADSGRKCPSRQQGARSAPRPVADTVRRLKPVLGASSLLKAAHYSPYGTQMFFTWVAWARNSVPSPWRRSNQSR